MKLKTMHDFLSCILDLAGPFIVVDTSKNLRKNLFEDALHHLRGLCEVLVLPVYFKVIESTSQSQQLALKVQKEILLTSILRNQKKFFDFFVNVLRPFWRLFQQWTKNTSTKRKSKAAPRTKLSSLILARRLRNLCICSRRPPLYKSSILYDAELLQFNDGTPDFVEKISHHRRWT